MLQDIIFSPKTSGSTHSGPLCWHSPSPIFFLDIMSHLQGSLRSRPFLVILCRRKSIYYVYSNLFHSHLPDSSLHLSRRCLSPWYNAPSRTVRVKSQRRLSPAYKLLLVIHTDIPTCVYLSVRSVHRTQRLLSYRNSYSTVPCTWNSNLKAPLSNLFRVIRTMHVWRSLATRTTLEGGLSSTPCAVPQVICRFR